MSRSLSCRSAVALLLLLLCALPAGVRAQQTQGAVSGSVRSTGGGILRGVELVLEGINKTTLSNTDGEFLRGEVRP